ncbi:MAG: TerB family tellurite resistance protein [Methylovirgula sp.]|nr:TerB family tellurite resistance protein [Methylovirgula sp.]
MFDQIRNFVAELTGAPEPRSFSPDDFRLAAAALLVHLAGADGTFADVEQRRLHEIIETRFGLDNATTTRLIELAEVQDRQAVDFYHFTHALTNALDQDGRQKIITMMWEIAFADGTVTEVEESIVARIADLLGVSRQDRLRLRQQVADEVAAGTAFAGPWAPATTAARGSLS